MVRSHPIITNVHKRHSKRRKEANHCRIQMWSHCKLMEQFNHTVQCQCTQFTWYHDANVILPVLCYIYMYKRNLADVMLHIQMLYCRCNVTCTNVILPMFRFMYKCNHVKERHHITNVTTKYSTTVQNVIIPKLS